MAHNDTYPILQTTHGCVKGRKRISIYDMPYYSFEKIPYAQPPLGPLRFKDPEPSIPWLHILDCTECGDKPLQRNFYTKELEGSEDCLYLNVYVKKVFSEKKRPVMVYIFGGAYQNGGASRDIHAPDYFMFEDVILVTVNYRLGPLGFLCLDDPDAEIPGNAGLKDQLLALQWIRNNCFNFRGDPHNITLFGHSAGAAMVHHLMLAKPAMFLFQKAILMSGTVFNEWALTPKGDYAFRLAKVNGYQGDNVDVDVLAYLKGIEGSKLVGLELMNYEEFSKEMTFVFGPTIESYKCRNCIIPRHPLELSKNAWSKSIPIIIGGTSFEGLVNYQQAMKNEGGIQVYKTCPEMLLPHKVRSRVGLQKSKKLGKKVLKMFMGDSRRSFDVMKYLEIYSYSRFWHGFYRAILSRLKNANAFTYVYRFDFDSEDFNFYRLRFCGPSIRGVSHGDDLSYLFYGIHSHTLEWPSNEHRTIRRMIGIFTSFARTANPNCAEIQPTIWEPVEQDAPHKCLNISTDIVMVELPEASKLQFWNSMYTAQELF